MTVHVLIPVFNRMAMTENILGCLRRQTVDQTLRIIVIDDGSSDGTARFLASQPDIVTIKGDGNLWWAGAIQAGLRKALETAKPDDYVLMLNNDTCFEDHYVQKMVDLAKANAPAAIGSIVCDATTPDTLQSIGAKIDSWKLKVREMLAAPRPREIEGPIYRVDVLSGRGTLYPVAALRAAGAMRPWILPHYLADYELAIRVARAGFALLVSEKVAVLSTAEFGNARKSANFWQKYLSVRSPSYLPALISFWWGASQSNFERITLFPRLLYVTLLGSRCPS